MRSARFRYCVHPPCIAYDRTIECISPLCKRCLQEMQLIDPSDPRYPSSRNQFVPDERHMPRSYNRGNISTAMPYQQLNMAPPVRPSQEMAQTSQMDFGGYSPAPTPTSTPPRYGSSTFDSGDPAHRPEYGYYTPSNVHPQYGRTMQSRYEQPMSARPTHEGINVRSTQELQNTVSQSLRDIRGDLHPRNANKKRSHGLISRDDYEQEDQPAGVLSLAQRIQRGSENTRGRGTFQYRQRGRGGKQPIAIPQSEYPTVAVARKKQRTDYITQPLYPLKPLMQDTSRTKFLEDESPYWCYQCHRWYDTLREHRRCTPRFKIESKFDFDEPNEVVANTDLTKQPESLVELSHHLLHVVNIDRDCRRYVIARDMAIVRALQWIPKDRDYNLRSIKGLRQTFAATNRIFLRLMIHMNGLIRNWWSKIILPAFKEQHMAVVGVENSNEFDQRINSFTKAYEALPRIHRISKRLKIENLALSQDFLDKFRTNVEGLLNEYQSDMNHLQIQLSGSGLSTLLRDTNMASSPWYELQPKVVESGLWLRNTLSIPWDRAQFEARRMNTTAQKFNRPMIGSIFVATKERQETDSHLSDESHSPTGRVATIEEPAQLTGTMNLSKYDFQSMEKLFRLQSRTHSTSQPATERHLAASDQDIPYDHAEADGNINTAAVGYPRLADSHPDDNAPEIPLEGSFFAPIEVAENMDDMAESFHLEALFAANPTTVAGDSETRDDPASVPAKSLLASDENEIERSEEM